MGVQRCTLKIDSKVIASQIEKECMARDETLERYLAVVRRMENFFKGFTVKHIERAKNTEVDELAKATARKIVEPEPRMVNIVQGEGWRAPIMANLRHHSKPNSSTDLTRM
jgi:ribonuclease HI